jgi:hypothetical protein
MDRQLGSSGSFGSGSRRSISRGSQVDNESGKKLKELVNDNTEAIKKLKIELMVTIVKCVDESMSKVIEEILEMKPKNVGWIMQVDQSGEENEDDVTDVVGNNDDDTDDNHKMVDSQDDNVICGRPE